MSTCATLPVTVCGKAGAEYTTEMPVAQDSSRKSMRLQVLLQQGNHDS
jgi:hypothetical protein